ncbi:Elongator complex protein 5 [Dillenia turbinata]|uniref:Elongator complex protein 5 n=1 Tax=Dillenia turbinata TaxID=194707 RepID=A0AAN8Z5S8_9MAGN
MAESVCRALRDGSMEGEHAAALTVKDSMKCPYGHNVFNHVLTQLSSNILSSKSQSKGLVLVALSQSPSFYYDLLRSRGIVDFVTNKWIHILDGYNDPLGWKKWLSEHDKIGSISSEIFASTTIFRNIKDLDQLLSLIIEVGKGLVGQGKGRFSVAIDSVSEMLRHVSLSSLAGLLSKLRGHDQISSTFWLLHSDLHDIKATAVLEYMSTMVITLEQTSESFDQQQTILENLSLHEQNSCKGKIQVRMKRRNGRVRVTCEEFDIDQSGMKFSSASPESATINQSLLPKVQFNLQLTEKERMDKENVVLPFEHQGNGKTIQIYDGRRALTEGKKGTEPTPTQQLPAVEDSGKGDIIYFRDSDDEMPDSDEDPDDDLDI